MVTDQRGLCPSPQTDSGCASIVSAAPCPSDPLQCDTSGMESTFLPHSHCIPFIPEKDACIGTWFDWVVLAIFWIISADALQAISKGNLVGVEFYLLCIVVLDFNFFFTLAEYNKYVGNYITRSFFILLFIFVISLSFIITYPCRVLVKMGSIQQ